MDGCMEFTSVSVEKCFVCTVPSFTCPQTPQICHSQYSTVYANTDCLAVLWEELRIAGDTDTNSVMREV